MGRREWLEVAIRVLGVYVLFWAVTNFAEAGLMYADYSRNPDLSFRYYLIYAWIDVVVGLVFLRAPWVLTNFAYGPEPTDDAELSDSETSDDKEA